MLYGRIFNILRRNGIYAISSEGENNNDSNNSLRKYRCCPCLLYKLSGEKSGKAYATYDAIYKPRDGNSR